MISDRCLNALFLPKITAFNLVFLQNYGIQGDGGELKYRIV
jgi:hypothetical protein